MWSPGEGRGACTLIVIRSFETFQLKSFSYPFISPLLFQVNISGFVLQIDISKDVSFVCTEHCPQFYSFKASLASKFSFQLQRGVKTKRISIVEQHEYIYHKQEVIKKIVTLPFIWFCTFIFCIIINLLKSPCPAPSVTQTVTWRYLGNQACYHRSAGAKTTRKIFQIRNI